MFIIHFPLILLFFFFFFFFNDTATTEIYTLSLHDALPIRDVPFRDLMAERLGLPVFVDNDATAAMLAEWRYGAAVDCSDALLLTIGTGIGGGMVVGGKVGRGA